MSIPGRTKPFFQYCIKEWSKLNDKIKNKFKFKVTVANFIRPKGNSVLDIHGDNGYDVDV